VREMSENLYQVGHFYTGDFAQFLTSVYNNGTFRKEFFEKRKNKEERRLNTESGRKGG
jgi:hypothetical protein